MALINKKKAIYASIYFGPTFGSGYDLRICDKADKYKNSYAKLGDSY